MSRHEVTLGPINPRLDEEEGESTTVRPPVVESPTDRLNPEVEYEVLDLSEKGEALKNKLNELGKEGWALVATEPAYIFRRIKKPEEAKKRSRVGFSV